MKPLRRNTGLLYLSAIFLSFSGLALDSARATTLYWDTNGNTAGSGAATGTWDSSTANWTPDSTGAAAPGGLTTSILDNLFFSAGTNGTTGTVTVSGSQSANSITFDDPVAVTISGGTGITLGGTTGAGIFQTGAGTATNTVSSALTLNGAQAWTNGTSGSTLAIAGTVTRNTGASVNFTPTGTINLTGSGLANDASGILGGWATVGNGGGAGATADWAAVDGSGNVVTYSGYTTFSGTTSQTLSGTTVSQNWKTSSGSVTTISNSGTINSLVTQGDVLVSAGNTLTLGSGGLILSGISRWIKGPNGNTTDTGQLTSGLASGELFVDVASSAGTADNWRIWTKIVDHGGTAVKLVKTGPGSVDLSNANSYTGGTYLNSGTLGVSHNSGLGTGTLTMAGGALNITKATANIDLANNIVISGSNNQIYLGVARNLGLNGTISGSGELALGNSNHNSTIYLSGANTMTSGTITLVNNTNSVRFANANAGNANVSWVINNTTANRNTLDFSSGTISFGSMTGNGIIQSNGAGTKTISAGALGLNDTFSGVIANGSGTLALTKVGSGRMTLSGNNTYNGATSVNAGTLKVTGSIGNSAVTVSNTGTVLASGTTGTIGSSVTVNNGAILAAGDRNAAGTATVTGATTFNDGSIFSWDINGTGTGYDKLVTASLVDGNTTGGSVFQIIAADANFSDPFWSITRTWADIFTTNGTAAIANWANVFSSVTVVNGSFDTITPVNGSFSVSGTTLTWSAVPEPSSALAGLLLGSALLRRRRI